MIGVGATQLSHRWHTPEAEAGPSTAREASHVPEQAAGTRDPAVIESELQAVEQQLANLYARARRERDTRPNAEAPAPHQIRTSTLLHNMTRDGQYMTVQYHDRTDAGRIRHHYCRLDVSAFDEIKQLSDQQIKLKAELGAAHKDKGKKRAGSPLASGRRRPGWMEAPPGRPASSAAASPEAPAPGPLTPPPVHDEPAHDPLTLVSLPHELVLEILKCMSPPQLHQMRQVDRFLEALATDFLPAWRFSSPADLAKIADAFEERGLIHKIQTVTLAGPRFRNEDLAHLSRFPNLNELKLLHCEGLDDMCGASIARCERLKGLNVADCDFGNALLAWLLPHPDADNTVLEELTLDRNVRITDACAPSVLRFRALRKLSADNCDISNRFLEGLTPEQDNVITENVVLEEINFANNHNIDENIGERLRHFPALRKLNLQNCDLDVAAMLAGLLRTDDGSMGDNETLEEVNISYNHIDDAAGAHLHRMRKLRVLNAASTNRLSLNFMRDILGAEDDMVPDNEVLEELIIDDNEIGDAGGDYLAHFRSLKSLHAFSCAFGDDFLRRFLTNREGVVSDNHKLEALFIGDSPRLTDASADFIVHLRSLKNLNLYDCDITDDFFKTLVNAEDGGTARDNHVLEELDISSCDDLTNACGRYIARFRALRSLQATSCGALGDEFVANLFPDPEKNNPTLQELNLSAFPDLTDRAAPYIARMEALRELAVSHAAGIGDIFLKQLLRDGKNTTLASLELNACTGLTDACADSLSRFLALTTLYIDECTNLSGDFLKNLPPSLEVLHALDCNFGEEEKQAVAARVTLVD